MRNIIFLLLLSHSCFSQVFEKDTTFEFSGVTKFVNSKRVSAINLPDGKVIFNHEGTFVNDSLQMTTFVWEPQGDKLEPFEIFKDDIDSPLYYSQLSSTGVFIFYKTISYGDNGITESTLLKIDLNGNKIEGFDFKEEGFLFQVMELADGKILARFSDGVYKIYTENGEFENVFSLSAAGLGSNVTLNDVVFFDGFYYFLLVQNDSGKVTVKRTDEFLANAKDLYLPSLDNSSAPQNKLFKVDSKVYLYTSSLNDQDNHLYEFDSEGNPVRDVKFGKVGNYMSSLPEIFWSDAGEIALRYYDNDWIKFNTDGSHKIYPKESGIINFQKNGLFLNRTDFEVFEANFETGLKRKVALSFAKKLDFKPTKVFASENGLRLVEYTRNEQYPFLFYHSYYPSLLKIFNDIGEEIRELYDDESKWNCSEQGELILIRGKEKVYVLANSGALTEYDNKWPTNAQFDLKNGNVFYENRFNENELNYYEIIETDLEGIINTDFVFKSTTNYSSFQFLPSSNELALFTMLSEPSIDFFNIETSGVLKVVPNVNKDFSLNRYLELIPTEEGIYLKNVRVGGTGSYSYELTKINTGGALDANFEIKSISGGQFHSFTEDGSLIINALTVRQQNGVVGYNSVKLLPNGDVDNNFIILSNEPINHFSQQNADTLFTITPSGLYRFIKNDKKEAPYFYVESEVKSNISWDQLEPTFFKVHTAGKPYTISLSDNAKIQNDSLYIDSRPGYASIDINTKNGYFSYRNYININKATPFFIHDLPDLYAFQGPTWLKFSSSSGEPVYVKLGIGGTEYADSIQVDPNRSSNKLGLYLRVGSNDYYTSADEYLLLDVLSPLANEATFRNVLPYPNPSRGTFLVPLVIEEISKMELVNSLGQGIPYTYEILSKGLKLNVPHYTPGIHVLTLLEHNEKHVYRLMLE